MSTNGGDGEYHETVGEFTTLKAAVCGAQPTRIVHESDHTTTTTTSSEDLARHIAQRKAGDPNAYERASIVEEEGKDKSPGDSRAPATADDRDYEHKGKADHDNSRCGGAEGRSHNLSKFRVPLLLSGAALAVVGVVLAFTKRSKDLENNRKP